MTRSPSTSTPSLRLDHHMADPDGFYETLLNAHQGLSAEQSAALNARLILLLANQIGDAAVLDECIALATASG
jgi:hypothetical protein